MEKWDAVIVGGGIAGLCVGTLLASAGKKILVLEKEGTVGGRATSTTYRGHIVDNGIHGLTSLGYTEEILSRAGKALPDYIEYEGTEVFRGDKWQNLGDLLVTPDIMRMFSEGVLPLSYEELDKLDNVSIKEWGMKWTDNREAHLLLWFLAWAYLGGNKYEDMVANELLMFVKEAREKRPDSPAMGTVNFCQGLSALTGLMVDAIRERGCEIRTNARVTNVVIEDGKARGVKVEAADRVFNAQLVDTEFIEAGMVIITLPVWDLFNMVSEDEFPQWYVDWVERIAHKTAPLFTLICGLDSLLWDNWKITRWVPKLPRTGLGGLFLLAPITYAESVGQYQAMFWLQTHWDEAPSLFDVNKAKNRLGLQKIFDDFEADIKELFPDFEKHCLWKIRHVDTFGLARAPGLTGWHRPSIKPPLVENVYLVSDTVREARGSGMESCARAALCLVDQLLQRK